MVLDGSLIPFWVTVHFVLSVASNGLDTISRAPRAHCMRLILFMVVVLMANIWALLVDTNPNYPESYICICIYKLVYISAKCA